jgi:hypothetical protein
VRISIGFVIYGVVVGLLSVAWHGAGREVPLPLNIPGELLAYSVYERAIQWLGNPGSPQADLSIPWLLRLPQVYVVASTVFWGLAGLVVSCVKLLLGGWRGRRGPEFSS